MKLYDYNLLSEVEKIRVINKHGVTIAERFDIFHSYKLYQLFSFYTEVSFGYNSSIESNRSFSAEKLPEMYLEQIDISTLTHT
jgi:hypothetical protein